MTGGAVEEQEGGDGSALRPVKPVAPGVIGPPLAGVCTAELLSAGGLIAYRFRRPGAGRRFR